MADPDEMPTDAEIGTEAEQFVSAGRARIAGPLDSINALANRIGGQDAMMLHALHGALISTFHALLNHVAGIKDPDVVVEEPAPEPAAEPLV